MGTLCFGEEELHLLMLYLYYGAKADCMDKDAQIELCRKLENYITVEHMEAKKLVKLYPKLVCIRMYIMEIALDERLEKILKLTSVLPVENQFRYYSQTELEILGEMGKMLYLQKKYDEGICLLESVVRNQKKSRIIWEYQWGGFSFVLRILADLYFGVKKYEEANCIEQYVLENELSCLDAVSLPQRLDGIADNYEHLVDSTVMYIKNCTAKPIM